MVIRIIVEVLPQGREDSYLTVLSDFGKIITAGAPGNQSAGQLVEHGDPIGENDLIIPAVPDGTTTFQFYQVQYTPKTIATMAQDIVNTLANNSLEINIQLAPRALPVRDAALCRNGGVSYCEGDTCLTYYASAEYDVARRWPAVADPCDCDDSGFWAIDDNGVYQPLPSDVILLHELSHFYLGKYVYANSELSNDDENEIENQIAEEITNPYRVLRQLQPTLTRMGRNNLVQQVRKIGGSQKIIICYNPVKTPEGVPAKRCLVAESYPDGKDSALLNELRALREEYLLRTRWGRSFFGGFHRYYYEFSTNVANRFNNDAAMRKSIGAAIAVPVINYLRIASRLPRFDMSELGNLPTPLREFLGMIATDLDAWTSGMNIGSDLGNVDCEAAAIEIAVALRFRHRTAKASAAYLDRLTVAQIIPLVGSQEELRAAAVAMKSLGATELELLRVLGGDEEDRNDVVPRME